MRGRDTWGSPSLPPKNCTTSPGGLPSPAVSFLLYRMGRTLPTPCRPWGCRERQMCVEDSGVLYGTSQLQLHVTPRPKLKHWDEWKKPDVGKQTREDSTAPALKGGKINPRCQNPLGVDGDGRRLQGVCVQDVCALGKTQFIMASVLFYMDHTPQ